MTRNGWTPEQSLSRRIAITAFWLWALSLMLPGFGETSRTSNEINLRYGIEILFSGWLGPVVGNFAWFANVGFIACIRWLIFTRYLPPKFFVFLLILALDAFRLRYTYLNEGGTTAAVFGLAWGGFVWHFSMALCFFSWIVRYMEMRKRTYFGTPTDVAIPPERKELIRTACIIFLPLLTSYGVLRISDSYSANESEQQKLRTMVYKIGRTCKTQIPHPEFTLPATWTFRITGNASLPVYDGNLAFLDWGYSAIQWGGKEYRKIDYGLGSFIEGHTTDKETDAIIQITPLTDNNVGFNIQVISNNAKQVVFDGSWQALPRSSQYAHTEYCPYIGYFALDQQDSLNLVFTELLGKPKKQHKRESPIAAKPQLLFPYHVEEHEIVSYSESNTPVSSSLCSADGFLAYRYQEHSLHFDRHVHLFCTANRIFLTHSSSSNFKSKRSDSFETVVHAIDGQSFQKLWTAHLALPIPLSANTLRKIEEGDGWVAFHDYANNTTERVSRYRIEN